MWGYVVWFVWVCVVLVLHYLWSWPMRRMISSTSGILTSMLMMAVSVVLDLKLNSVTVAVIVSLKKPSVLTSVEGYVMVRALLIVWPSMQVSLEPKIIRTRTGIVSTVTI